MNTVLIFANPIAGRGVAKRLAMTLQTAMTASGFEAVAVFEKASSVRDESLPDALSVRAVIAIGGDGTLRGVAQRLYLRYAREGAGEMPPILVVPLGTANLMGKHLGVGANDEHLPRRAVEAIARRQITTLDAATANEKLFLLMAGVGIDAKIVHELDRVRRGPIDMISYALPAALALQSYQFAPITVDLDGVRVFENAPALAFIGNVPEYGTGFPILPRARSDDGVLDVCILPCKNRAELVRLFLLAVSGEHMRAEGVIYRTAARVMVDSRKEVPVQIDGDAAGHTPLEIEMLATRVPFIVPI